MTKIDQIRKIVTESQYGKVDGVKLDGFTANAIIAVYDALTEDNQARYARLSISKMASIKLTSIKR